MKISEIINESREENFKRWFGRSRVVDGSGRPLVVYHGTAADIDKFRGLSIWAAENVELANSYSELRGDINGAPPNVMPLYMSAQRPFDADYLPGSVNIGSFFSEARRQAIANGTQVDDATASKLISIVKAGAREEESGPTYSRHDIWNNAGSLFGENGTAAIKKLFVLLGFDSIFLTEDGVRTWGVFSPTQVKSATGNNGNFDPTNPDITKENYEDR